MARKTVEIEYLKGYVNSILSNTSKEQANVRDSMATLLENVLMNANAYKGFRYLEMSAMGDNSRREYF